MLGYRAGFMTDNRGLRVSLLGESSPEEDGRQTMLDAGPRKGIHE